VKIAESHVSSAEVRLKKQHVEVDYWRELLARRESLYADNAISANAYNETRLKTQHAELTVKELENQVIEAQTELDLAKAHLGQLKP
jgi:hypothetical protein